METHWHWENMQTPPTWGLILHPWKCERTVLPTIYRVTMRTPTHLSILDKVTGTWWHENTLRKKTSVSPRISAPLAWQVHILAVDSCNVSYLSKSGVFLFRSFFPELLRCEAEKKGEKISHIYCEWEKGIYFDRDASRCHGWRSHWTDNKKKIIKDKTRD